MARKSYYRLSIYLLERYYNIVGATLDGKLAEDSYVDTHCLEDISPFADSRLSSFLPKSSAEIDEEMRQIMHKICVECAEFDYRNNEVVNKIAYQESINVILNTVTSLNLLEPGSQNYLLGFERLNQILLSVLKEINAMDLEEVIHLASLIAQKDFRTILGRTHIHQFTSFLVFLAMNPNCDLQDYTMFVEGSAQIDFSKLKALVVNNVYASTNFEISETPFNRMNFIKSFQLMPRKKD